jgi:hypothetical protein
VNENVMQKEMPMLVPENLKVALLFRNVPGFINLEN